MLADAFQSTRFYARYAGFTFHERFTNLWSTAAYLALYPFFLWLLTAMWGKFNAYQGHYTRDEIYVYLSVTELLFMTFLRSAFLNRSHADFSLALARPRSWLLMTSIGQFGSTLGGRLVYLALAAACMPAFGVPFEEAMRAYVRLLWLLPVLGVAEALLSTMLSACQVLWHETKYLTLPITKIFLALGGVFGPLADYGEPGRSWFLALPASDLFFQVGHYCVKGEFYGIGAGEWWGRIAVWIGAAAVGAVSLSAFARKRHQSFGG